MEAWERGRADGRGPNHSSPIARKNHMESDLISHWVSQALTQRRRGGAFFASPSGDPRRETPESHIKGEIFLGVFQQLCASCRAPQLSREKFLY